MDRSEMIETLSNQVVNVTFTKVNGEKRTMKATLRADSLPETKNSRSSNDDIIPVWDIENASWRSFRVDSVIEFSPVP